MLGTSFFLSFLCFFLFWLFLCLLFFLIGGWTLLSTALTVQVAFFTLFLHKLKEQTDRPTDKSTTVGGDTLFFLHCRYHFLRYCLYLGRHVLLLLFIRLLEARILIDSFSPSCFCSRVRSRVRSCVRIGICSRIRSHV